MKLYTIKELTEILKLSKQTILKYIAEKRINAYNISDTKRPSWRVSQESLENFLEKLN